MAHSRHRHKKHPQQQHSHSAKKQRRAAPVISIFIGLFGLVIAYFAGNGNYITMLAGLIVGAAIGYYIGLGLDRSSTR